jgi:hypothetical protein
VFRKIFVVAAAAIVLALAVPARVHAWGAYHVGYTAVGPFGGVQQVGYTAVGPFGGVQQVGYTAVGGVGLGLGAYQYSTYQYGGYPYGLYPGYGVGGFSYGYVHHW